MAINNDSDCCMYGIQLCQQWLYTFWSCNELVVWNSENCPHVIPLLQQEAGRAIDPFPDQLQRAAPSNGKVYYFSFIYLGHFSRLPGTFQHTM